MSRCSGSVTTRLTRDCRLSPFTTLLLISHKMATSGTSRFLCPRYSVSPFLLPSVRGTTGEVEETVRSFRGVTIFNSCSTSNIASTTIVCDCLRDHNTSIVYRVPSEVGRNCNVSPRTIRGLGRHNISLVVAISGNVSTFSTTGATGRLSISLIVASRRGRDKRLPRTITIISPREASYGVPFHS